MVLNIEIQQQKNICEILNCITKRHWHAYVT